ncbi:endo-beta-N-acetylglucosaminidase [Vallitalea longa]|uniref:Endo-beta-N-acetylglucosaminidase n=1 Tax=Vallitalea longa TaxID=2936439 RepID=A0A9W5YGY1_9FIRM|nr:discoidin domain-containing protein [Vallitalea longa]GKX32093.1 endo-beta-N-acetylglucosaminidase [Vallitalea longa]
MKKLRVLLLMVLFMTLCMGTQNINAKQPYASYWYPNELLEWTPENDEDARFNRGTIPLADRFTGDGVNSNAMSEPKVQIFATMNPSTSDNPSQGSDIFERYTFNYWQYVDSLVMWGGSASEGIIVTPSADVIDAAHKNGVKVLGCVNFQPDYYGGKLQWVREVIKEEPTGVYKGADKLIEVAEYYKFDGWFMHEETQGATKEDAEQMQAFMKYFQENKPEGMELHWYDSMSSNGSIQYENALTSNNEMFFQDGNDIVTNGFFTNYWWNDMSSSRDKAVSLGRSQYDVYAGVYTEANGYNEPDSQFYVEWEGIFPEGQEAKTSLGMYRPDWTFRSASDMKDFYDRANRFWVGKYSDPRNTQTTDYWKGIAHYIIAKSSIDSLPFTTNFNTGNGHIYAINGEVKRQRDWNNRSLQDVLPTWRWIADSTGTPLNPSIDWETAYYGGSSLKVSGNLNHENATQLRLYKTNLPVESNTELSITYKTPIDQSHIKVGILFTDNNEFSHIDIGSAICGEWTTKTVSLDQYMGRNIGQISLDFDSDVEIPDYEINIGQIAIRNIDSELPQQVSNLSIIDQDIREGLYADARLTWDKLDGDIEVYEIYRVKSDGTKEFIGATPNNAYYVSEMRRDGYETETTLEVVALDDNYNHGQGTSVSFEWPEYPAPIADFTVSKTLIEPNESITFYNDSTEAAESIIWDFTGGTPSSSSEDNPQVTYSTEGVYSVSLTASNAIGEDVEMKEELIVVSNDITVSNVAVSKNATADTFVQGENPDLAVDDVVDTKWCATGAEPHWLVVDLGMEYTISEFVVKHAEAGGEGPGYNTRDYKIQVSNDGSVWTDVVDVKGNTSGIRSHAIALVTARYVRLYIIDAGGDSAARIYEFQVMGYTDNPSSSLPESFNLIAPTNNARWISRGNTSFDWQDSVNASSYQIIVDDNSDFSSPEIDVANITSSNYISNMTLSRLTNYYWKVIATNSNGSTECNSISIFKTSFF